MKMRYMAVTSVLILVIGLVVAAEKTKFIFTFYHRPKSFLGWLMNPMIKMDQKKNRLKALESIKSYAENGTAIKN